MSMRALATLAALVVLGGALAGCVGGPKDDPVNQTGAGGAIVDGGNAGGAAGGNGLPAGLTVRAPLVSTLTLAGPSWVATGTSVAASLTAPANANGTVTYLWSKGALPGTTAVTAAKADTGSSSGAAYIAPGATKSITYTVSGIYQMHCHPHPYMRSNVTVIDGYQGPSTVDVYIVDGDKPSDNRYVPENIVVGKGTTVVYHNVGLQPHTATALGAQSPPLTKIAGLTGTSGDVTIDGTGWQRVVVAMLDKDGRVGLAEKSIYTTATLPTVAFEPYAFAFEAGAPTIPGAPAQPVAAKTASFKLDYPASLILNYTFSDAASTAQNLAVVEIHLTPQGETQDIMTVDEGTTGTWEGKAPAGTYTLSVTPRQGVQITGEIVVAGSYELTPPDPTMAAAGDGHGDHAGH